MITPNDKPSPSNYDGSYINPEEDKNFVNQRTSSLMKDLSHLRKSPQIKFVRPQAITENKNEVIKPHHLFYDPLVLGTVRPHETFKNQFTEYGIYSQIKNHPIILEIKNGRENYFKFLLELSSNLPEESCAIAFYELIITNLDKGLPLTVLFPLHCTKEAPEELKNLYDEILATSCDDLEDFMDLESLTPENLMFESFKNLKSEFFKVNNNIDTFLKEAYDEIEKAFDEYTKSLQEKSGSEIIDNDLFIKKIDDKFSECKTFISDKEKEKVKLKASNYHLLKYIESFSKAVGVTLSPPLKIESIKIVRNFIKTFWNKDLVIPNPKATESSSNRKMDLNQPIKNVLDKITTENKVTSLNLIINSESNDTQAKDLLDYILGNLSDRFPKIKGIHNKCLLDLKQKLKSYVLDAKKLNFFIEQKKRILSYQANERLAHFKDPSLLKILTKEYKQHSLARFDHLFNHFTAFANVIDDLGNFGNTRYPNFKVKFREIVSHLIQNSNFEISSNSHDKTLKNNSSVISDLHRETMGKEEVKRTEEQKSLIRAELNLLVRKELNVQKIKTKIINKEKNVIDVDRAHTLPFPVLFAWDSKKFSTLIDSKFEDKGVYTFGEKHYFGKDIYKKMKDRNFSHKEIVNLFHEKFETLLKSGFNEQQLLFQSLELVKNFFLNLFSETELLPDFMNKSIDNVSEWGIAKSSNYKISLAKGLNDLIQMESPIKESDTVVKLRPYLDETVDKLENNFINEQKKMPTTASTWNLVCLSLVKEALMKTVEGVAFKEALDDVNKNIRRVVKNQNFEFSITHKVDLAQAVNKERNIYITKKHDAIMKKMLNPIKV